MKKILLISTLLIMLLQACEKAQQSADCSALKEGLENDDIEIIQKEINFASSTTQLSSNDPAYEELKAAIDKLAVDIEKNCGISVTVYCYGCIDTLPGQSEIALSFLTDNTIVKKTIDISVKNQQLVVVGVHE